jgi:hypothetical protein
VIVNIKERKKEREKEKKKKRRKVYIVCCGTKQEGSKFKLLFM